MGLTIHYQLQNKTRSPKRIRDLLTKLRGRALDLPFDEVGEIIEATQPDCDFQTCNPEDPNVWLFIQAVQHIGEGRYSYKVIPTHVIAFESLPGEGSEAACFGLCRYPATIEVPDRQYGGTRHLATKLYGWSWSGFCKTEYASRPERGGVANFLKCHLLVVAMLEHARSLGILGDVSDEGNFWEGRDFESLAKHVGGWNDQTADLLLRLKDLCGDELPEGIFTFPEFRQPDAAEQPCEALPEPISQWLDGAAACRLFNAGRLGVA
jgi:hypothetical protein